MLGTGTFKQRMPQHADALPSRAQSIVPSASHHVLHTSLQPEAFPGAYVLVVGMGCFWGAERRFWTVPGVLSTSAGYAGGYTAHPTYDDVCSGRTGHAEVVRVVYDPHNVDRDALLRVFWENHDPTQGMRQGRDVGTPFRSVIYVCDVRELAEAEASAQRFQRELARAGYGLITTEIALTGPFYFAEDQHQQYLSKHPEGDCGLGGTGVTYPRL
ncbi:MULTISPECIES: peptide-methionine (S)-S-oxide reductase MsrA [unclassified Dyella]|uniref:peptide-methionine (S)-S-oxide reductase MsrA n=1 Tax=unclassified Dyella TaxID=2634549 RepID=UPI0018EE1AE6|nr:MULTISPECIES: peptide-methionine (S)-S-oxide reductase MsrA [unclassified Dyella]MDR3445164.1 peptide-methionine (S)-S-oxide reductase MsrA [Dyella sp.]